MKAAQYLIVLLCLFLTVAGCGFAQGPQKNIPALQQPDKFAPLLAAVKDTNIHGMTIYVDDQLQLEYYQEGYNKDSRFAVYSCTKSIVSALVGIAIDEKAIKSTEQYAVEFFPEMGIIPGDTLKGQIRLQHLLSQTSGLDWPEWSQPSLIPELMRSNNWVQYIWERPMETEPGKKFNYNSGNSHLLSAIIQQATGQTTCAYAQKHLFQPLGITNYEWIKDGNNIYGGGFGLSMTVQDLSKIGLLYLHQGEWQGKQLVSKEWVKKSLSKQSEGWEKLGNYGYQWWVRPATPAVKYDIYFASGYAGQYILIVPELNAVVVYTSWLSNEESGKPIDYLEKFIIPALEADKVK